MVSGVAAFCGTGLDDGLFGNELAWMALDAQLPVLRAIREKQPIAYLRPIGELIGVFHDALRLSNPDLAPELFARRVERSLANSSKLVRFFQWSEGLTGRDLLRRLGGISNQLLQLKRTGRIDEDRGLKLVELLQRIQSYATPDRGGCF